MKPDALRMLGWVVPLICMALAGWILFREHGAFDSASAARNQANRELEAKALEEKSLQNRPAETRYAAVDDIPEEESGFLTYLRMRCAANAVHFKTWSSATIEYGKDKAATPKDEKTATLLKGIRKINGAVTFAGSYDSIRKLLKELESSDRLFTLTNISWHSTKEGTELAMTISRYVAPAKPAAKKKGDTSAKDQKTNTTPTAAPPPSTVTPGISTGTSRKS